MLVLVCVLNGASGQGVGGAGGHVQGTKQVITQSPIPPKTHRSAARQHPGQTHNHSSATGPAMHTGWW